MSTAPCTARHANAPRHHRVRHRMPAALRPAAMVALAALCLASAPAWAESLITGIAPVQDQHGAALLIRSTERPAYDVNTINGGYRVQIDFSDAHFANSVGTVHGEGVIQDVLAENLPGKARLDLLLKTPQAIMIEPAPGGYRIALVAEKGATPSTVAAAAPVATPAPSPAAAAVEPSASAPVPLPAANGTSIADLGFKRGKEGGGILDLTINGSQPQMNVTREDGALVVDLKDTQLPASYAHRFDVNQFGTPVQYIDSYPRGANTRLVFAINGPFEYSAYQLGNHLLVNVRAKPATETAAGVAAGARLSMDFQNISVRDALQVIADFTHQNIVVSNNVTGTLTIRLKNVPWEQAFKVILDSQGLAVKHIGNILWVAPANQISTQEEAELKAAASKRKLEPLVTELIPIKYARATEIAQLLQGFSQQNNAVPPGEGAPYGNTAATAAQNAALAAALGIPSSTLGNSLLGSRGSVAVVTRTNSLLVRDTPQDIDNIKKLIAKIDRPVPQVLIEARIVQITTNAAQSLGVQWGGTYTSNTGSGVINLSGTGASGTTNTQGGSFPLTGSTTTTTGTTGFSVPALINLPAYAPAGSALTGLNPASLGMALGTATGSRVIDLQLQALQAANKAKIISSPKVLTADNEKAVIQQGQEIPYQQATSSGATSVSFKKAVLSLDVTPHIAPNGKITMDVSATNDQPNYAQTTPSGVPINTQQVKTKLLVANGQTVVIGGIFTDTHSNYDTGIPLLQDIPGLGWLFKSRTNNIAQTELLIFLTPKVINDGAQDGSAGGETSLASGG
ncbi:MAG: type IV pilus secretin PilQ family protein [Gammaproteobacteria bacterium]|nr:type IV pilus secretin PilQ family protein [Gammaproteobacteria bacterium]